MLYSFITRGFYSPEVHGSNIPADAVEITSEQHAELLSGQSGGLVITSGPDGRPVLQDPPPLTAEQLQAQANAEARAYLARTDWYVIRLQETGEPVPSDILAERAAARARVVE